MDDLIFSRTQIPFENDERVIYKQYVEIRKKIKKEINLTPFLFALKSSKVYRAQSAESISLMMKLTLPTKYKETLISQSQLKRVIGNRQSQEYLRKARVKHKLKLRDIASDLKRIADSTQLANEGLNLDAYFGGNPNPPTLSELNSMISEVTKQGETNPQLEESIERFVNKTKEYAEVAFGGTDLLNIPIARSELPQQEVKKVENEPSEEISRAEPEGEESIFQTLSDLHRMTTMNPASSDVDNRVEKGILEDLIVVPRSPPPPQEPIEVELHGRLENLPKPFDIYRPIFGEVEPIPSIFEEEEEEEPLDYDAIPEDQGYFLLPFDFQKVDLSVKNSLLPLKFSSEMEVEREKEMDINFNVPLNSGNELDDLLKVIALSDILFSYTLTPGLIEHLSVSAEYYYQSLLLCFDAIQKSGLIKHFQIPNGYSILQTLISPPMEEIRNHFFIVNFFQEICSTAASAILSDIPLEKVVPFEQIPYILETELLPSTINAYENSILSFMLTIQSNLIERLPNEEDKFSKLWDLQKFNEIPPDVLQNPKGYVIGRKLKSIEGGYPLSYYKVKHKNKYPRVTQRVTEEWWEQFSARADFFDKESAKRISIHYWHKFSLSEFFLIENDILNRINGDIVSIFPDEIIMRFLPHYRNLSEDTVNPFLPSDILIFQRAFDSVGFHPIEQNYLFPQYSSTKKKRLLQINPAFLPKTTQLLPPISLRMKNHEGLIQELFRIFEETEIKYLSHGFVLIFTLLGIKSDVLYVGIKLWGRENAIHYRDVYGIITFASQIFQKLEANGIRIY